MKEVKYKGYTIRETDCTVDVIRYCFGREYIDLAYTYEIVDPNGHIVKPYGQKPWITSVAEGKRWVNG